MSKKLFLILLFSIFGVIKAHSAPQPPQSTQINKLEPIERKDRILILTPHPDDVNVDHKAFYLFLRIALGDLEKELPRPKIYPYLIHHVGWPLPRRYHPELSLEPPEEFLNTEINWMEFKLGPEQLKKKYQAILCYKSQTESSAFYLLSFARQNELFGDYPEIETRKTGIFKGKDSFILWIFAYVC